MATKLTVVTSPQPGIKPSRKLGQHGAALWRSVMNEYAIVDSGGIEMLTAACQALDRAESLREQINRDGEVIRMKGGVLKDHPALKHELANRAFVVRTLHRLGLDVEAIKPIGRPTTQWGG
jgi:hypothetical protein